MTRDKSGSWLRLKHEDRLGCGDEGEGPGPEAWWSIEGPALLASIRDIQFKAFEHEGHQGVPAVEAQVTG